MGELLLISVTKWGGRKTPGGSGGIYLIDFKTKRILKKLEVSNERSSRTFGGITYDKEYIYAAIMQDEKNDVIWIIDPSHFQVVKILEIPKIYDVHQIDIYEDILWITNTNYNEIVAVEKNSGKELGRFCVDPSQPEECVLKPIDKKKYKDYDYKKRIHINSIHIEKGEIFLTCFGFEKGNFNSSQLISVSWKRRNSQIIFGGLKTWDVLCFSWNWTNGLSELRWKRKEEKMPKQRRHYSPEKKVEILREHFKNK
ncbi:MAG: hypothetical protein LWW94_03130, partial [Candidatus Desulfofervidaceae bacterium]|nr:hypothetical protein [Candidatus Desulfofervidaceae bacterium]